MRSRNPMETHAVQELYRVEFPNADGQMLAARLDQPDGEPPHAFALFAHCFTCSKDSAAASRVSRALTLGGYAVLRFDFTGLGGSEGDFANTNFSSNVEDLVAAAQWLASNVGAPSLLIGHSLGGAAVLAAAPRIASVRAVVTIAAPSDPNHLADVFHRSSAEIETRGQGEVSIGGRPFTIKRQFLEDIAAQNLTEAIQSSTGRALLILHAPDDPVVDIEHARRIFEAAPYPKGFVSLDGADHLLSEKETSRWVAGLIAAWAARHV